MDNLVSSPSELEVLHWFSNYRNAFSLAHHKTQVVKNFSDIYGYVYEHFTRSRQTAGRGPQQVYEDLRMFGFDCYDFLSDTSMRFFSQYRVDGLPRQYQPLPTSGFNFVQDSQVIWPRGRRGRWIASAIRNSSAHHTTSVRNGVVRIENIREPGGSPDFRIFLPVRQYVRMIACSLKYFVEHVVQNDPRVDKLGRLETLDYGRLLGFLQVFLGNLRTAKLGP